MSGTGTKMSARPTYPPLPEDARRGWTVTLDGREVSCRSLHLESVFGTLSYGWHPKGYDTWGFAEEGGGGALCIPTCLKDGEWLVGLVEEDRANLGGRTLCAPGGFVDPKEQQSAAARREVSEETGIDAVVHPLEGVPFVPNRAFFFALPTQGQGIHAFTFEVPPEDLQERTPEGYWRLPPRGKAELDGLLFMPWRVAVARCPDALSLAAIARLLAMRKDLP